MGELPELVCTEGDEDVQYVLIELPALERKTLRAGQQVTIQGLDTDTPTVQLADGPALQGTYRDNLGTMMLFKHTITRVPSPGDPEGAAMDVDGQNEGAEGQQGEGSSAGAVLTARSRNVKLTSRFIGMTETCLAVKDTSKTTGKGSSGASAATQRT